MLGNGTRMRDQAIGGYLDMLAARVAAPGGGAVAALQCGMAAALLTMAALFSDGPRHAGFQHVIGPIAAEADELRDISLSLADQDASAFSEVIDARRLSTSTEADRAARSAAIAEALAGAARPPAELISVAGRLIELAGRLLPVANRNLAGDIAASAQCARAAAITAQVNIELNVRGVKDEKTRAELTRAAARADQIAERAEEITAAARAEWPPT